MQASNVSLSVPLHHLQDVFYTNQGLYLGRNRSLFRSCSSTLPATLFSLAQVPSILYLAQLQIDNCQARKAPLQYYQISSKIKTLRAYSHHRTKFIRWVSHASSSSASPPSSAIQKNERKDTTCAPQPNFPITSSAPTIGIAAPKLDLDLGDSVYTQTIYSSSSFSEAEKEKLLTHYVNGSYIEPDDIIPPSASPSEPTYTSSSGIAHSTNEEPNAATEAPTSRVEQVLAVEQPARVAPPFEEQKECPSPSWPSILHRSSSVSNLQVQEAALVPSIPLRHTASMDRLDLNAATTSPVHSLKEWASLFLAQKDLTDTLEPYGAKVTVTKEGLILGDGIVGVTSDKADEEATEEEEKRDAVEASLQAWLRTAQSEKRRAQNEARNLKKDFAAYHSAKEAREQVIKDKEEELKKTQEALLTANLALDLSPANINDILARNNTLEAQSYLHEKSIKEHTTRLQSMSAACTAFERHYDYAFNKVRHLNGLYRTLVADLRAQVPDLIASTLQNDVDLMTTRFNRLETELAHSDRARRQAEYDAARAVGTICDQRNRVTALETEARALRSRIDNWTRDYKQLHHNANDTVRRLTDENGALQKDNHKLSQANKRVSDQLAGREREVAQLAEQKRAVEKRADREMRRMKEVMRTYRRDYRSLGVYAVGLRSHLVASGGRPEQWAGGLEAWDEGEDLEDESEAGDSEGSESDCDEEDEGHEGKILQPKPVRPWERQKMRNWCEAVE